MEEANNLKNVMLMYSKSLKNKERFIYVGTEKQFFKECKHFYLKFLLNYLIIDLDSNHSRFNLI